MLDIGPGTFVKAKEISVGNSDLEASYKPHRGQRFFCLLIDTIPMNESGKDFDTTTALKNMGLESTATSQSEKIHVSPYKPRFTEQICIHDLEKMDRDLKDSIYESACENEYSQFNYHDGDFHFMINFETDKFYWLDELKEIVGPDVVAKNKFAIWITQ